MYHILLEVGAERKVSKLGISTLSQSQFLDQLIIKFG